ncbi:serine hydrolase [Arsukibacterium sp. MJ3]|uniref:serine hydrolase n=1 Tax=Arsukibacterium sp. MJ3 TaxID=1632859 RepID=UPI00069B74B4|nr:serine hydrolase [Arsukibacterium sp. MJ3]
MPSRTFIVAVSCFCLFPPGLLAVGCDDIKPADCYDLKPLLIDTQLNYPILHQVLQNQAAYKVQIIYTQIDRNADKIIHFTDYQYGLNESEYFYPASTVKLPVSLLALQWLEEQQVPALTKDSIMLSGTNRSLQSSALSDVTAENNLPSIAHYIKKILLVSDNDAYNRLYELLGQDYINHQLQVKGLMNTVINHRLSLPLPEFEQRHFNPIRFLDNDNNELLSLPARYTERQYLNTSKPMLGKAHIVNGKLVNIPMDFTDKNRFSLLDFNSVLKRIIFPKAFKPLQQFNINQSSREFVLHHMTISPSDSLYPSYTVEDYPDNYAKFLLVAGDPATIPPHFNIVNKTGWAYGHAIDGAYIVDTDKNIEFLLVAVIYANQNDILNDDKYQLEEIAKPFMRQLGQLIYSHELKRRRAAVPALTYQKTNRS